MRNTTVLATSLMLGSLALLGACSAKPDAAKSGATSTTTATATAPASAMPKAGLWEMSVTGSAMPTPMKTRMCMGEAKPGTNPFTPPTATTQACAKNSVTKTADGYAIDMECAQNGVTMATKGTVTGDFSSSYKTVMTSKMTGANIPAMMQNERTSTAEAKYLGACPAGMAPGAVSQGA